MAELDRHLLIGSLEFLKSQFCFNWLAIPVKIWKVRIPKYHVEPKLLSDTIHRLLHTGPMSIEELHSLTGLDKDLILYIITAELRGKVVSSGNMWKVTSDTPVESHFVQYAEYAVFQSLHSGELIPRPQRWGDSYEIRITDVSNGYPYIECGTKGKPLRIKPFFLPYSGQMDPKPPEIEDILTMWAKFREDLSSVGEDTLGRIGGGIPPIKRVESVVEADDGYLLTSLISDQGELDGWLCADPFGLFKFGLPILKNIVADFSRSVPSIAKNIEKHESDSCSADYYRKAEELFGSGLPHSLHTYIARYMKTFEEWETEPNQYNKSFRAEQLMISNQLVLESLFQCTWTHLSCAKNILRSDEINMRDRETHIKNIAQKLGLSEIETLVEKLKNQNIWKRALYRETSLKSALLYRLFLVQYNPNDPFHELFKSMSDLPGLIVKIADFRNKSGHAQLNVEDNQIDSKDLHLFYAKTKEIIGMTINRRQ